MLCHPFDNAITFRMDSRIVERLPAAPNSQEPGRLFKCLSPQLGDIEQLAAACKWAMFVAVINNPQGQPWTDARHIRQKRDARHVHINANRIDVFLLSDHLEDITDAAVQFLDEVFHGGPAIDETIVATPDDVIFFTR